MKLVMNIVLKEAAISTTLVYLIKKSLKEQETIIPLAFRNILINFKFYPLY